MALEIKRIQLRRDTIANWTTVNPVLAEGEYGYETDTGYTRIGDGSSAFLSLPRRSGNFAPFENIAAVIADTTITTANSAEDDIFTAGTDLVKVAADAASDQHFVNANGVKFYVISALAQSQKLTTGTLNAYLLTSGQSISTYWPDQAFLVRVDRANTGNATLNVDSIGVKNWKFYDETNTLSEFAASGIAIGDTHLVSYDGTQFVSVSITKNRNQFRNDTLANWTSNNPILAVGETGFETDTGYLRIGDGASAFLSLPRRYGGYIHYDDYAAFKASTEASRSIGAIWRYGDDSGIEAVSGDIFNSAGTPVQLDVVKRSQGWSVDAFGEVETADDTAVMQAAMAAASDGDTVFCNGAKTYTLKGELDTSGTTIGKKLYLNGATIQLNDNAATIKIGQQGSGLFLGGGELRAQDNFTGSAVTMVAQTRASDASRAWFLNDGNILCNTVTGKALSFLVDTADTRIVGLLSSDITLDGFEYGSYMNCDAPSSIGFINDNHFTNLRIAGNTARGVHLEASASATNEVSGNTFTALMTQYSSGVTVRNMLVADIRCKQNKFVAYDAWDIGGQGTLLVEDLGTNTMWIGCTISSSGGVSSLSPTAIGIINKDAGSQVAELLLGDYKQANSVATRKVQTFDTADLTSLDVRDGGVMIEGTVISGTRLTNIIQGGDGQSVTIIFGGNTLLSNAWGGAGQIFTHNGGSRYPAPNEVSKFIYDGTDWYEVGAQDAQYRTANAAAIADIANAINTTGKFTGKLIWDTTNNRQLRAAGSAAASLWYVVDGSASVTPA